MYKWVKLVTYSAFLLMFLRVGAVPLFAAAVQQGYKNRGGQAVIQGSSSQPAKAPDSQPQQPHGQGPVSSFTPPAAPYVPLTLESSPVSFSLQPKSIIPAGPEDNDLTRIVSKLKVSSQGWTRITNPQTKELTVYYFISEFKDKGIKIQKRASDYAQLIDEMSKQTPDLMAQPFERILQIVAIIEYDFDNGQDKDQMARSVLGDEGYLRNKERLGIK